MELVDKRAEVEIGAGQSSTRKEGTEPKDGLTEEWGERKVLDRWVDSQSGMKKRGNQTEGQRETGQQDR